MFEYCDNYSTCNSTVRKQTTEALTLALARAKGWHIYDGPTMGGGHKVSRLCDKCVGQNRRAIATIWPPPEGYQTALEFEVTVAQE